MVTNVGIGSWPARRARISPNRVALSQGDRTRTYAELAGRTRALAAALAELGVAPGDRIAYLGANDVATFETLFATGQLGAVFVPLNTRLAGAEIGYMLHDSGAAVLVHGPDSAGTVAAADVTAAGVKHVVALDPATSPVAGALEYEGTVARGEGLPAVLHPVTLDDPCLILYTSGTTGRPKGAILTHGNLTWNTINQLAHYDVASSDVVLCIAPLFHVTGLGQVTLPTLFKGGQVEVAPRFDPGWALRTIEERRITGFAAVPTMLQMMCEHVDWEQADVSSLRHVVYGGSPVSERTARAWLARGIQVLQGYGMTEASPGVYMAVREGSLERPVSVGVPHFFTDVAILDGDTRRPAEDGVPGELLVSGPNVFGGYWGRPEETAASFVDGTWFRTGDVVRVDPDGWAYAVDRVKDMIISGGENIYPAEVEAVIAELEGVASAAVVGVPDERWGEVGMAFIVRRSGSDINETAVQKHLLERLAKYKVPKYFRFADDLPRNATGKILRIRLRETARQQFEDTASSTDREPA